MKNVTECQLVVPFGEATVIVLGKFLIEYQVRNNVPGVGRVSPYQSKLLLRAWYEGNAPSGQLCHE